MKDEKTFRTVKLETWPIICHRQWNVNIIMNILL